jgi:formylmethanofuran dehydrogenase subunit C
MPVVFELKSEPNLPIDVRALNPERLSKLGLDQIGKISIGFGNKECVVSQWFSVSGDTEDSSVEFRGNLDRVHSIGFGMCCGRIEVHGNAGRHLGNSMTGGEIVAEGNVDDYAGSEMQGGTIVIRGNAADHVGGCYPGAKYGMNRGTILISGSAGMGLGYRMRRGTIVVGGDVGEHCAWQMRAGTIIVFGKCNQPVGLDMKRGTVICNEFSNVPDSFSENGTPSDSTLNMLGRWLSGMKKCYDLNLPDVPLTSAKMWHGDSLCGNRGEIFLLN